MGTIIYFGTSSLFFFFSLKKKKEKKRSVGKNDKKILEHQFGRDDGSRSSFWSWY
uniref:Ribosomal protein S2 n=1 Tax=Prunus campanulata TaxID=136465 RepID=A0A8K1ZEH6_9ROSA|nr:ribosomal protein S2 [Prunus campanulata]UGK73462.1 ribosomal protein S2 [Prunus campanulata]